MPRPRLLLITERFPPDLGGVATSAGRLARSWAELGFAVDVLVWTRFLPAGEVQLTSLPDPIRWVRVGQYRQWDMTMPVTMNVLEGLHSQAPYDAVWGHYLFPAGFLAVWFGQLHRIRSVVSVRGNDIDRDFFPPGDFGRLLWTIQQASLVTTVSQNLAHKVKVISGRSDPPLVIRNAVDTTLFSPQSVSITRQQLGILPEEIVLGFAGELREKKGQSHLLQALRTVRQHQPACLLVIGEVRPTQQPALQLFQAQYPEDGSRVIVTGHLPDPAVVAQHLRLCDLYLQPSLWEGMPNALLEAMATGLCCIASDAGGIPEVIEPGRTGFILPRIQLGELGSAVLEALELSPEHRHQIGMAARQHIQAEFSLAQEQELLTKVLARLMPNS